jgi:hypothetical protein
MNNPRRRSVWGDWQTGVLLLQVPSLAGAAASRSRDWPGAQIHYRSISARRPKTTARAALSPSRSISSSPKVRVSGWHQKSPIRSARVEIGKAEDVEELGASRGRQGGVCECAERTFEQRQQPAVAATGGAATTGIDSAIATTARGESQPNKP